MSPNTIEKLLRAVASGETAVPEALSRLRTLPFEDLGYARLDHHRHLRRGFPEIVYGEGKTVEQCTGIVSSIAKAGEPVLVTRATAEQFQAIKRRHRTAEWHEVARMIILRTAEGRGPALVRKRGRKDATKSSLESPHPRLAAEQVMVVTAGTSDISVAEEAAITAEVMGASVGRCYDVGVAGLHRILSDRARLEAARAIVVVAGMEGALPSVVAGLVSTPVIGVPTSVGYGAALGGLTALFAMLTSCASGVTVVNIDNGFGAGFVAAQIARRE